MKYSEKRKKRLVPFLYEPNARYHQGAWKHWPASLSEPQRAAMALREAPSNYVDRGFHRFTSKHVHKAVEFQSA